MVQPPPQPFRPPPALVLPRPRVPCPDRPCTCWCVPVQMAAPIPVHGLLGLRLEGLGRAIVDSLYLCITLFIGPLVYFVYTIDLEDPNESNPPGYSQLQPQHPHPQGGGAGGTGSGGSGGSSDSWSSGYSARAAAGGGGADAQQRRVGPPPTEPSGRQHTVAGASLEQPGALGKLAARVRRLVGDWRLWRNLVAAPLTEEWVFRACMAPLLVMEVGEGLVAQGGGWAHGQRAAAGRLGGGRGEAGCDAVATWPVYVQWVVRRGRVGRMPRWGARGTEPSMCAAISFNLPTLPFTCPCGFWTAFSRSAAVVALSAIPSLPLAAPVCATRACRWCVWCC